MKRKSKIVRINRWLVNCNTQNGLIPIMRQKLYLLKSSLYNRRQHQVRVLLMANRIAKGWVKHQQSWIIAQMSQMELLFQTYIALVFRRSQSETDQHPILSWRQTLEWIMRTQPQLRMRRISLFDYPPWLIRCLNATTITIDCFRWSRHLRIDRYDDSLPQKYELVGNELKRRARCGWKNFSLKRL